MGGGARWWGGRGHRLYTVVVLVVLASLDNTALQLLPPLFGVVSADLAVPEPWLGLVTALTLLLTALAAAGWGYLGDRVRRKPLLVGGTLLWAAGMAGSGLAPDYATLLATHLVAAVGTGAVASVGFAVVADLIPPRHRGIAMSFWGLSQGVGAVAGTLVAGTLGADAWRLPFLVLAVAGGVVAAAYAAGFEIPRGFSEPELAELFARGQAYPYRIEPSELPLLVRRRTNVWLVLQGLTAQVAYGSLIWLPRLFQSKVAAGGTGERAAVVVGSLFAALFQAGGLLAIAGGWLGDRLQQRSLRARPLIGMVGILAAIPFLLAVFFLPLRVSVPEGGSTLDIVLATVADVVQHPTVAATFAAAFVALALTSADSPNWHALIGDVNLPEHRGTVFGAGNLANGIGRAAGHGLVGAVIGLDALAGLPEHVRFAVALAGFQAFFLPTGWMYWRASRTAPGDIRGLRAEVVDRARGGDGG